MSPGFKREYMKKLYFRYKKTKTRFEKYALITGVCTTCNWHRNHAIRALGKYKRSTITPSSVKKRGKPSK